VANLCSESCIIDGEAVVCGDDGIASFDRIRYRRHDADVFGSYRRGSAETSLGCSCAK
jgi:ATP-dependent DNA ligase